LLVCYLTWHSIWVRAENVFTLHLCMCLVTGAGVIWIWFCQRSHLVGKLIDCLWQWGVGSHNVLSTGILSNATVARVGESASKTRSSQVPVACFVAVMHEETTIRVWDGYMCCTAGDKMELIAEERHQEFMWANNIGFRWLRWYVSIILPKNALFSTLPVTAYIVFPVACVFSHRQV
jgi:hypothetical protein